MPAECGQEFNIYGFPLLPRYTRCYNAVDGDLHLDPGPYHINGTGISKKACLHHTPGQTYSQSNLPEGYW